MCNSAVKLGRNLGGGEKGRRAGCVPVCSRLAGTGEYRNNGWGLLSRSLSNIVHWKLTRIELFMSFSYSCMLTCEAQILPSWAQSIFVCMEWGRVLICCFNSS